MFTEQDRQRVHDRVLEWATSDPRVAAGAVVGSLAHHPGDRFSDLDLTFGVRDDVPVSAVLDDWSRRMTGEFDAAHLFDVSSGAATYRVFLLPGCLQVDLSCAPAASFGAIGPQFRLLFGSEGESQRPAPASAPQLFGYGVHHAVRARICIERSRYWQAEYWTSAVRDYALTLACVRLGLPAHYGRGFDALPDDVRGAAQAALVRSLDRAGLLTALRRSVDLLLAEGAAASACPPRLDVRLRDLIWME